MRAAVRLCGVWAVEFYCHEEWTRVTYEGERVVVHELVDPGARAHILRKLPSAARTYDTICGVFCPERKSDGGERVFDIGKATDPVVQ